MLDVMIVDESVIEHGSLAADLMSMNGIGNTLTRVDLKLLCAKMKAQSRKVSSHFIGGDEGDYRAAA